MDQIYDAGPGAPEIVVVLKRSPCGEALFRELCSALATVAAEDPCYTVYVSNAETGTCLVLRDLRVDRSIAGG